MSNAKVKRHGQISRSNAIINFQGQPPRSNVRGEKNAGFRSDLMKNYTCGFVP